MFEKDLIVMPAEVFGTKEEVIRYLTHLDNGRVTDPDGFERDVLERESTFVTYVGYGIGMPHARTACVTEPFVVYAKLKNSVRWGEDEEEEANQVFLLGVPQKTEGDSTYANLHLKVLAMLSRHLMHEEFRRSLEEAADREEIYTILNNITKEDTL